MTEQNYEKMSIDELREEINKLGKKKDDIVALQRMLKVMIDKKLIEKQVKDTVDNMSDEHKKAMYETLHQTVGVNVAKSKSVGNGQGFDQKDTK